MTYDKVVYFVKNVEDHYDPDAGEWKRGEAIRIQKFARVISMPAERQNVIYGDVKPDRYIVHLLNKHTEPFDFVEIDGVVYYLDKEHCPINIQSLVVKNGGN